MRVKDVPYYQFTTIGKGQIKMYLATLQCKTTYILQYQMMLFYIGSKMWSAYSPDYNVLWNSIY